MIVESGPSSWLAVGYLFMPEEEKGRALLLILSALVPALLPPTPETRSPLRQKVAVPFRLVALRRAW